MVMLAGTQGDMKQTTDRRFEEREWPIQVKIEATEHADSWFTYMSSEATARGWNSGGMAQLDAQENSGSHTVHMKIGADIHELVIVWDRTKGGPLTLRASAEGDEPLTAAREFIDLVTSKCKARVREAFYVRGQVEYSGLPWRGEMWLDDSLRLGPPTIQEEKYLLAPRIIIVDALVPGVDRMDAGAAFALLRRELSAFLSVVLRVNVQEPRWEQAWVFDDVTKPETSAIRHLGYLEAEVLTALPPRGGAPPAPLRFVARPDFSLHGISMNDREEELP